MSDWIRIFQGLAFEEIDIAVASDAVKLSTYNEEQVVRVSCTPRIARRIAAALQEAADIADQPVPGAPR